MSALRYLTVAVAAILFLSATGHADAMDPLDFASLGPSPFTLAGMYTIDTGASPPVMTLPDSSTINGVVSGEGIAVFTFDSVEIGSGITIEATGSRPLAILSHDSFLLDASSVIDVSGATSTGPAGGAGGPGGGMGGASQGDGTGPGGGGGSVPAGAAGGGFGGAGGDGGGTGGGVGGSTYGDLATLLQGGSGGGSAGLGGGGGGGAIEIGAVNDAEISGTVLANGGAAATNFGDGGGSGGGVFIHAASLDFTGSMEARGGDGAAYSGSGGTGGGGGGGRVLLLFGEGTTSGTIDVAGGSAGAASSGAVQAEPGLAGVASIVSASLELVKTTSPQELSAGETVTWTATVTNEGPDPADEVTLVDDLPDGVALLSAIPSQGTCEEIDGVVTCDLLTIEADQSVTVTLEAEVLVVGEIVNEAAVTGNSGTATATAVAPAVVAAATDIPVDDPWMLMLLVMGLAITGAVILRR